jgi:hypothetical protein
MLEVGAPAPLDDRPKFGRVGLIVALCFGLGVAWPRLARVTLVPRPPGKELAETPASHGPPEAALPSLATTATAKTGAEETPPAASFSVEKSYVVSCQSAGEQQLERAACDKPALDALLVPELLGLAACPAAGAEQGLLSIGLDVSFAEQRIDRVLRGKSTTLSQAASSGVLGCAEQRLTRLAVRDIAHRYERYSYFYQLRIAPALAAGGAPGNGEKSADESVLLSGVLTVVGEAAAVREQPTVQAAIEAELEPGTRVRALERRGSFYRIEYGERGAVGWLHAEAFGL